MSRCRHVTSCGVSLQMVSAVIQEDRHEVSLTVSFAAAELKEKQVCLEQVG